MGRVYLFLIIAVNFIYPQTAWQQTTLSGYSIIKLVIAPNGYIFAASSNNGVFRSTDGGETWANVNKGLTGLISLSLVSSANGTIYYSSRYDKYYSYNGGVFRTTDFGESWIIMKDLTNYYYDDARLILDNAGIIYINEYYMFNLRDNYRSAYSKTIDGGMTWSAITDAPGYLTASTIAINGDLIIGTRLWQNNSNDIYRSTNGGTTWTMISQFGWGPSDNLIAAINVNSAGDIFIGKTNEGVYKSTDIGTTWVKMNNGLDISNITSLAIDDKGRIFAGSWGYGVFLSEDNGGKWRYIIDGLTNANVKCMAFNSDGYLFVGTEAGVYRSSTNTVDVNDRQKNTKGFSLEQNFPNPFNPKTQIAFELASMQSVSLKLYNVFGKEVAVLVDGEKPAGRNVVKVDASVFPSGVYFYTLRAGAFSNTKKLVLLK